MGDGQVTGNQSVHWKIDHEDGTDLRVKQGDPNRPRRGDPQNVHVKSAAAGRDESKGVVDFFDVTLRFESSQQPSAVSQLTDALSVASTAPANSSFFVTFKVPAKVNGVVRADPDDPNLPKPDVRIRW